MKNSNPSVLVQSLLGKNQIDFYLRCLKSLIENCRDPIELHLHSDGSLSEENKEEILCVFENQRVSLSTFSDSLEKTLDELHGKPNCQRFRKESIWGIEFFDPLFAQTENEYSFYLDADILFFKPFQGLFDCKIVEQGAIFLRDKQWDAYSLRPWHLIGSGKKPKLVRGITTALVCWDKRVIDWDYLEWFLGQRRYHKIPEWIMPTAQAGLAARCEAKTLSTRQIPNLYPNAKIDEETFGVHLLGSYRKQWLPKIRKYEIASNVTANAVWARFEKCQGRRAIGYGLNQIKRWRNTRLDLW